MKAAIAGHTEIVTMLEEAGASTQQLQTVEVIKCMTITAIVMSTTSFIIIIHCIH